MEWISTKQELPPLKTPVLGYAMFGHRWQHEICVLFDGNGKNGKQEYVGMGGRVLYIDNKPFPDNLYWNIGGHNVRFNEVTHWAKLIDPPKEV